MIHIIDMTRALLNIVFGLCFFFCLILLRVVLFYCHIEEDDENEDEKRDEDDDDRLDWSARESVEILGMDESNEIAVGTVYNQRQWKQQEMMNWGLQRWRL